jgi:phytoene/squalene synthetase
MIHTAFYRTSPRHPVPIAHVERMLYEDAAKKLVDNQAADRTGDLEHFLRVVASMVGQYQRETMPAGQGKRE